MERDTIFLTHHTLDTLAFLAAVRRVLDTTDTERVVAATYSPVVECWLSRQKHPRLTVEYASKQAAGGRPLQPHVAAWWLPGYSDTISPLLVREASRSRMLVLVAADTMLHSHGWVDLLADCLGNEYLTAPLITHSDHQATKMEGPTLRVILCGISAEKYAANPIAVGDACTVMSSACFPFVRSPDNVHHDYTPLWVQGQQFDRPCYGPYTTFDQRAGWGLFNNACRLGLLMVNLSPEVRKCYQHLYMSGGKNAYALRDKFIGTPWAQAYLNEAPQIVTDLWDSLAPPWIGTNDWGNVERCQEQASLSHGRPIRFVGIAGGMAILNGVSWGAKAFHAVDINLAQVAHAQSMIDTIKECHTPAAYVDRIVERMSIVGVNREDNLLVHPKSHGCDATIEHKAGDAISVGAGCGWLSPDFYEVVRSAALRDDVTVGVGDAILDPDCLCSRCDPSAYNVVWLNSLPTYCPPCYSGMVASYLSERGLSGIVLPRNVSFGD